MKFSLHNDDLVIKSIHETMLKYDFVDLKNNAESFIFLIINTGNSYYIT